MHGVGIPCVVRTRVSAPAPVGFKAPAKAMVCLDISEFLMRRRPLDLCDGVRRRPLQHGRVFATPRSCRRVAPKLASFLQATKTVCISTCSCRRGSVAGYRYLYTSTVEACVTAPRGTLTRRGSHEKRSLS